MAKYFGKIGYIVTKETSPGIWKPEVVEHTYSGDVLRNSSNWSGSSDSTNDNLSLNSQISIVADPFAYQNFHSMKYIHYLGGKWKITNVEPKYPRLILTIGGVYNGKSKT